MILRNHAMYWDAALSTTMQKSGEYWQMFVFCSLFLKTYGRPPRKPIFYAAYNY